MARQVRKRQEFRKKAVAAIGLEKSSLKLIAAVMTALLLYMAWSAPQLVFPAFSNPLGIEIFQYGIMCIFIGFHWSNKVANIKV